MLSGFVALMTTAKRAVMTRTAIALPAKSCNTLDCGKTLQWWMNILG